MPQTTWWERYTDRRVYRAGEPVCLEGDTGDEVYIVSEGQVVITKETGEGDSIVLGYRKPDEMFGEIALIAESPRTASAMAMEPTTLRVILRDDFWNLMRSDERFQRIVMQTLIERLLIADETRVNAELWERQAKQYQQQIEALNEELGERVTERTAELQKALEEVKRLSSRLEAENIYLRDEIKLAHDFEGIVTQSSCLGDVLERAGQVAETDATVLILGETGTGKELVARAIHSISPRRDRPLVKVDCASLPANLIESELFGHEKGAFTGALSRRIGRFELADNGTIFLDEVGEMPLELQAKFLRVLQEGEFERLGGADTTKVDVRVIAATNRDLEKEIADGNFREDLYYRLNVFPVSCPPLRERKEDIEILVKHFLAKYCAKMGKKIATISPKAMVALQAYDWPGNVRELENIIERAMILNRDDQLEIGDWFQERTTVPDTVSMQTLEEAERRHIVMILERSGWKIRGASGAAELLGMKPTTLEGRMKKLGIERPDATV